MRPDEAPKVNVAGIEETVTDKGYHSGAVVKRMKAYEVRSYIPEKKQKGRRDWAGKPAEQQAVYANRRRVRGEYGKSLLRRRGELVERSFAHCYETGKAALPSARTRKHSEAATDPRGRVQPEPDLRKLLGAGTLREWRNLCSAAVRLVLFVFLRGNAAKPSCRSRRTSFRPHQLGPAAHPGALVLPQNFRYLHPGLLVN